MGEEWAAIGARSCPCLGGLQEVTWRLKCVYPIRGTLTLYYAACAIRGTITRIRGGEVVG